MGKIFTGEEAKRLVNISYNLRYTMMDKNTNPTAVARKAGIAPSTLRSYIHGDTMPDSEMIDKLAKALGCTSDDLTKEYDHRMPNSDRD